MAKSKAQILAELDEMDVKFTDTMSDLRHSRGAVQDMLRVVIPILQEQNNLIRDLVNATE